MGWGGKERGLKASAKRPCCRARSTKPGDWEPGQLSAQQCHSPQFLCRLQPVMGHCISGTAFCRPARDFQTSHPFLKCKSYHGCIRR